MSKNSQSELPYACLIVGVAMTLVGITGKTLGPRGDIRIMSVSDETRLLSLFVGIIMTVLSILYLRKHKFIPPAYTDDDIRQAKEKLDRMYLREHGALPGAPTPEAPETPAPAPADAPGRPAAAQAEAAARPAPAAPIPLTPEQKARMAKANARIRQGLLLMLAGAAVFYAAGGAFLLIPAMALLLVGLTRLAVGVVERS